jgi:molybdopterin-containing oxidoreductase family iron-sulfur binding subunit
VAANDGISEGADPDRNPDDRLAPPLPTTNGAGFDRRRFLRVLGLGTLGVVPLPILSGLIRDAAAAESQAEPVHGHGEPARTRDGRVRQWTMIIDLRACDGCQSTGQPPRCTAACIEGHFAPEPMEWMEVFEADLPGGGTQFIPTPCQQCQNPPCVNVCPVAATFSTPEGTVLIDQERCIGCRICMAACPYDRRFFNWGNAPVPPEALLADYSPEHQVPAKKGTVMKCDFCPDMARTGTLPYCIQGCPQQAIYYGDLEEDVATNGREVVSASRFLSENGAYRLKEDLGTEPRVYYIPGHGEAAGRDAFDAGRSPTEWPWMERAEGAVTWRR